jgi:hypothetical protein
MTEEQKHERSCGGSGPHFSHLFENCVSEATREHFRASRVEFWKGIRSIIDHHIDRMSRTQQKGSTVPVD